mmetsp:Transcript_43593/g.107868  ORF Transcript_43593/g.107868 Transcript_43593/m.107868 type:complete len:207 (+) Transcript_43593:235-855(+)
MQRPIAAAPATAGVRASATRAPMSGATVRRSGSRRSFFAAVELVSAALGARLERGRRIARRARGHGLQLARQARDALRRLLRAPPGIRLEVARDRLNAGHRLLHLGDGLPLRGDNFELDLRLCQVHVGDRHVGHAAAHRARQLTRLVGPGGGIQAEAAQQRRADRRRVHDEFAGEGKATAGQEDLAKNRAAKRARGGRAGELAGAA